MKLLRGFIMEDFIIDTCRYCGRQFSRKTSENYKYLCTICYHQRFVPISNLITAQELNDNWEEKKHLLDFKEGQRHEFNCLCCGKHQKVLMEYSGNFMCSECMNNEFYPRREKYKLDFTFLKNNWIAIIETEKLFEKMIINDHDLAKNVCDNMFEFLLEKINMMVMKSPFYALNKKYSDK